jgi:hypothetical protein
MKAGEVRRGQQPIRQPGPIEVCARPICLHPYFSHSKENPLSEPCVLCQCVDFLTGA